MQSTEYMDGIQSATIEQVLSGLRMDIVAGKRRNGEKLVESELGKQYGVSRGTVRSALSVLQSEGLVHFLPTGRKEVVSLTQKKIYDLYDLRWIIENRALEIIFKEQYTDFATIVKALREARKVTRDMDIWGDIDLQFHRGIVEASGNQALLRAWEHNLPVIRNIMHLDLLENATHNPTDEHREIFNLMVVGDERVFDILHHHIMDFCPMGIGSYWNLQRANPDALLEK